MSDFLKNLFLPSWAEYINIGIRIWNACVGAALTLLETSPASVGGGNAWAIMKAITGSVLYQAIASSLVSAFFLYGLSKSALDFGRNFRIQEFVTLLIPLAVAETVILNFSAFVESLFSAASKLIQATVSISGVSVSASEITVIDAWQIQADLSLMDSLLMGLFAFIAMLVLICCGVSLIIVVYNRFFKLLLIVPLGCLALPAAAAGHSLQGRNPAAGYIRTFAVYLLEAVVILYAICLCTSLLVGADIFGGLAADGEFGAGILYVLDIIFVCLATVALAKGAEMLLQKIFG